MQELPLTSSPFGFQTHFLCGFKSKCAYVCACREGWRVLAIYRTLRIDNASLNWSTRTHREKTSTIMTPARELSQNPGTPSESCLMRDFFRALLHQRDRLCAGKTRRIRSDACSAKIIQKRHCQSVNRERFCQDIFFFANFEKVKARMKFKLLLIGIFTGGIIF